MELKVIGKPNCPNCDRAKTLLNYQQIPFIYLDASKDPSLVDELREKGIRTVPAIFLLGEEEVYMGGYAELRDYVKHKHAGGQHGIDS